MMLCPIVQGLASTLQAQRTPASLPPTGPWSPGRLQRTSPRSRHSPPHLPSLASVLGWPEPALPLLFHSHGGPAHHEELPRTGLVAPKQGWRFSDCLEILLGLHRRPGVGPVSTHRHEREAQGLGLDWPGLRGGGPDPDASQPAGLPVSLKVGSGEPSLRGSVGTRLCQESTPQPRLHGPLVVSALMASLASPAHPLQDASSQDVAGEGLEAVSPAADRAASRATLDQLLDTLKLLEEEPEPLPRPRANPRGRYAWIGEVAAQAWAVLGHCGAGDAHWAPPCLVRPLRRARWGLAEAPSLNQGLAKVEDPQNNLGWVLPLCQQCPQAMMWRVWVA